jgi:hypothetical protein
MGWTQQEKIFFSQQLKMGLKYLIWDQEAFKQS